MAITQVARLLSVAVEQLPPQYLLIENLFAREGLSQLFELQLELLHEETKEGHKPTVVDPHSVLGKPMTVSVLQYDGTQRFFSGICSRFTQGQRDQWFTHYTATVVPAVWALTQVARSRIFQNISVDKILKKIFEDYQVDYEIGTFEPRNYCVQYRETDWDFACRLMEEEGIYYFFEHKETTHRLVLGNTPDSHRPCPGKSTLPFYADMTELGDNWTGTVWGWHVENNLRTGTTELWDYNFQLPTSKLDATQASRFDIGGNKDLEVYDFPGGYAKRFDAIDSGRAEHTDVLQKVFEDRKRTVKIRQEEVDVGYKLIHSNSDCCSLTAGYRFQLSKHPVGENNINHVIVSAIYEAQQSPGYVTNQDFPRALTVKFTCIPHGSGNAPYRPPRITPKPVVHGTHTAVVSGPAGEEIYTDKYGRVKVQFPWDRDLKFDAESSAWLRVATSIAGKKWGTMYIPRVGQEVLIAFMEGDPDQPIIVGEVYNPETMPHYELPKYSTLTYIKTRTSPDDGKGFNELRFEDKQSKEQVFIHSQKRYDLRVRGSMYETCGGSRSELIGIKEENQPGGNLTVTVAGEHNFHVKSDQFITIDGGHYEGVHKDVAEEYKGKQQTVVTGKRELNAQEITLEAMTKITLKVGGSFITVDLSGITISGPMVKINSGGAGMGTSPMNMSDAEDAEASDNGQPGYLDRPRPAGGGGGRKWRSVTGSHAPPFGTMVMPNGDIHVGKGIVIKNDPNDPTFQQKALADLTTMSNYPQGMDTLNSLNNSGHTTTIQHQPTGGNSYSPSNVAGALPKGDTFGSTTGNGSGSDGTVNWNPDNPATNSQRPRDVGLHHELSHADHASNGQYDITHPDPSQPNNPHIEETNTINADNQYRTERGVHTRRDHTVL